MDKPTVDELGDMPDNFTPRQTLTAEQIVKAMHSTGGNLKQAANKLNTDERSGRFRDPFKTAQRNGWIQRTGRDALTIYQVTEKGRRDVIDQ